MPTMKRPRLDGYDGENRTGKLDQMGARWGCIKQTLQWTSSLVEKQLTEKLPAYAYPFMYSIKCQEAGSITTGTSLSFGTTDDPDEFCELTFTSYDAVGDSIVGIPTAQVIASTELALQLAATNGSGAEAGTVDDGTWDVCLWYIQFDEFETAS